MKIMRIGKRGYRCLCGEGETDGEISEARLSGAFETSANPGVPFRLCMNSDGYSGKSVRWSKPNGRVVEVGMVG